MNLLGFFEKLKFRDESSYYNIGYLNEGVKQGQLVSIEYCFAAVRKLLPENVLKAFFDKMNERLYSCTEGELATATYLMEKLDELKRVIKIRLEF